MRFIVSAILGYLATAAGFCQRPPSPHYEDVNNIPVSPEVHANRKVTFRLLAPKANDVTLMGSPGILEVIKKPMPLQLRRQGGMEPDRWSAVPRLLHIRVCDRRWLAHTRPDVPHGTVHVNFYDSPNLKTQRMAYVYTPPGYETGKQKYPVLYLLHGNGQIEAS